MTSVQPDIFQYLDYRAYLNDLIAYECSKGERISIRALSARILPSLSASGLLSGVLKGKKNLGPNLRAKFAKAFQLKTRESRFFELLVQFNQAESLQEKNQLFAQLSRFRQSRAKVILEGQYLFFSRWYFPVVWNYFGINQKQKNPAEIAAALFPPLTPAQVEEAIRLLLDLKLIKKLANGYSVTENHMATETEFRGLVAAQYSEQFLKLASESLYHVPPKSRQFTTMIFSSSRATVDIIKEKMALFQEEIQEVLDKDPGSECIHTFGMHLYPNTRSPE